MTTPFEVMNRIPTTILREIFAHDPHLSFQLEEVTPVLCGGLPHTLAHHQPLSSFNLSLHLQVTTSKEDNRNKNPARSAKKTTTKKKKPTGGEMRGLIIGEIERLAVKALCNHHASKEHLIAAVEALSIDHEAAGNNKNSRSVAAKRLTEHIFTLCGPSIASSFGASSVGLRNFLVLLAFLFLFLFLTLPSLWLIVKLAAKEKEASSAFLDALVALLVSVKDDTGSPSPNPNPNSSKSEKVSALITTLEREAMSTFLESLSCETLQSFFSPLIH